MASGQRGRRTPRQSSWRAWPGAPTSPRPWMRRGGGRARRLSMSWDDAKGMLFLRGALADVEGARFEATIHQLTERMTPAKGEAWDSLEHRAADALVQLCEPRAQIDEEGPSLADKPLLVIQVPVHGPAMLGGVALPDAVVEALRANVMIEPVLVDGHGQILTIGARRAGLSPKPARAILLRDGHCRCGTCEVRHGLELHHLVPRSWGGSHDPSNLAVVCRRSRGHHPMLIPQGPFALVGNPKSARRAAHGPRRPTLPPPKPPGTGSRPHPDPRAEPGPLGPWPRHPTSRSASPMTPPT